MDWNIKGQAIKFKKKKHQGKSLESIVLRLDATSIYPKGQN